MDKSKEYRLFYDENCQAWICTSDDQQVHGIASDVWMEDIDKCLAALLAVGEAMELDKGMLFDELKEGEYV